MNQGIIYMDCTIRLFNENNKAVEINKDKVDIVQRQGYTIIKDKK